VAHKCYRLHRTQTKLNMQPDEAIDRHGQAERALMEI
jgi:hypothetical protein